MKLRLLLYVMFLIWIQTPCDLFSSDDAVKSDKNDSPTVITCDGSLDVDFEKNIAIFNDNVVVEDQKGNVYSDLMKVFFLGEDREISLIEAYGSVVIDIEGKVAKSDKAVYDLKEGLLVLTGNPRITENRNIYAADKITIFRKDGKTEMKLEPKARLILYREEDGKEELLF